MFVSLSIDLLFEIKVIMALKAHGKTNIGANICLIIMKWRVSGNKSIYLNAKNLNILDSKA